MRKTVGAVRRGVVASLIALTTVAALGSSAASAAEPIDRGDDVIASFEGRWINLADGWGEAHACLSDDVGTRCYRSTEEMERVEGYPRPDAGVLVACGGPLYLHTGAGFSGNTLALSTRGVTMSLVGYGFNNVTSSYQIGPCAARFYDTTSGGTGYPGSTGAWIAASSMSAGWDNRVGSVYIS